MNKCVKLNNNIKLRIGREKNTSNCLPEEDAADNGVDICASGFCIKNSKCLSMQKYKYCKKYGSDSCSEDC